MAKKIESSRSGTMVITANRLSDGRVVWYGAPDGWAEKIGDAEVFSDADAASALERAKEWERREVIVEAYVVPVETGDADPVPVTMRERVRAVGPSVRSDLIAPEAA